MTKFKLMDFATIKISTNGIEQTISMAGPIDLKDYLNAKENDKPKKRSDSRINKRREVSGAERFSRKSWVE